MEYLCLLFFSVAIDPIHFRFAGSMDMHNTSHFDQIEQLTLELSALERLKYPHKLIIGKCVCSTVSPMLSGLETRSLGLNT